MSFITTLTRSWLTRSTKPFTFLSEYDPVLDYGGCDTLGLYVHIPFCRSICAFCPYCKQIYREEVCDRYIDALLREIYMVGSRYPEKKQVTSLYFGGGTPALAADRIGEIIAALREHFEITDGIGLELHPDNVTVPVLKTLKQAGVTRISIGIQSFQPKFQTILGRSPVDPRALKAALDEVSFETVSMDFIFALPGQTFEDLREDMELGFAHGANHVAVYPFIDFTFTPSPVKAMEKNEKRRLLDAITRHCSDRGYHRSSIWTFSNDPNAVYSSMTRENFLGFGCSATTLLPDQFKINTFDLEEYCKRIDTGFLPTSLTLRFSRRQRMVYCLELWLARWLGFVTKKDGVYEMTPKGAFYYHYYENFYTLSYIDKMWGVLRREAFPEMLEL